MRRALFALASLLAVSACGSMTDKQKSFFGASHSSIFTETMPGISDLDTETKEDKAEDKWWDGYYGRSSASQ